MTESPYDIRDIFDLTRACLMLTFACEFLRVSAISHSPFHKWLELLRIDEEIANIAFALSRSHALNTAPAVIGFCRVPLIISNKPFAMNSLVIWNFQVVKSLPSNFGMCRIVNSSDIFAQSRSVTDYISRKELHDQKKTFRTDRVFVYRIFAWLREHENLPKTALRSWAHNLLN